EIPDYGSAEMTRLLLPTPNAYTLVARVLPDAQVQARMQPIAAGHFQFRKDSPLGCACVGDVANFEAYWIDEAETSNREFWTYLQESGAPAPQFWTRLGFS